MAYATVPQSQRDHNNVIEYTRVRKKGRRSSRILEASGIRPEIVDIMPIDRRRTKCGSARGQNRLAHDHGIPAYGLDARPKYCQHAPQWHNHLLFFSEPGCRRSSYRFTPRFLQTTMSPLPGQDAPDGSFPNWFMPHMVRAIAQEHTNRTYQHERGHPPLC